MKKLTFLLIAAFMGSMAFGQITPIFVDNFDTYIANELLCTQNNTDWDTWTTGQAGSGEDALITSEMALSPNNSLKITDLNDIFYRMNNLTSGHYRIEFDYYIPDTGNGAYFNIQHYAIPGISHAFECKFSENGVNNGTGNLQVGGTFSNFIYPLNSWFHIVIDVNLDDDRCILTIDNKLVAIWAFHYRTSTTLSGDNPLGGVDFYASEGEIYFVDNFTVSLVENSEIKITDIGIVSLSLPVSGVNLGNENIKVVIRNNGTDVISNFQLRWDVNGNTGVETYSGAPIPASEQIEYMLTSLADFSNTGEHTVTVTAILAGDMASSNNAKTGNVTHHDVSDVTCSPLADYPVAQNFQDESYLCWKMISNNTANGYRGNADLTMRAYYWTADPTKNRFFAFSSKINAADYNQYYISPLLSSNHNGLKLSFDYRYYENPVTFRIGYSTTGNNVSAFTWSNTYATTATDFTYFENSDFPIPTGTKYIAIHYNNATSYDALFIDNVIIDKFRTIDAAVSAITSPVSGTHTDLMNENVTATIKNNGTATLNSLQVKFEVKLDGETIQTETESITDYIPTFSLAPGNSYNYPFHAQADVHLAGTYTITVTILNSDENMENNARNMSFTNMVCTVTALPLTQDFQNNSYLCWQMISNNTENTMGKYHFIDIPENTWLGFTSSNYAANGDYNQYLISPELPSTRNGLKLSFVCYDWGYGENFRIGYSTTTGNVSAFIWSNVYTAQEHNWSHFENSDFPIPPDAKYVAVNYCNSYSQNMLGIDNIVIDRVIASIPEITSFAINGVQGEITYGETGNTITLSGVCGLSSTSYIPEIVFSENATITPNYASGVNFASPVTFTVTSDGGSTTYTVTVTFTTPQTPQFNFNSELAYCLGAAPITLPSTSVNGIRGVWSPSSISTATVTATAHPDVYTFTAASGECAVVQSTSVKVTVNAPAIPAFNFGTQLSYCVGATEIQTLPTTSVNNITGIWTPAAISVTVPTDANPDVYTFTAEGCVTPLEIKVTVNALPAIPVITQSENILTSSTAFRYQWYLNGTVINGATSRTYVCTQSGVYFVEVTNEDGCTSQSNAKNVTLTQQKNYTISGHVTYNGNLLSGVAILYTGGDSVLTNTLGEYSITVDSNANVTLMPRLSGYSFTPSYITCANVNANLINQDFTASTTGITEIISESGRITVYPNPTTGELHITTMTGDKHAEIGIYDIYGRKQKAESRKENVVDISHLPAGVYFLRVGTETVKVVKQ